ncbi:hypothetical protein GCM10022295_73510 [Streptomyces osmaniensis]|uniref:Uncharacterized protein n=1 Tax=Streptomyces osmaniensis TaxID=593134 RepID=A0ABP6YDW6_9ACTN
MGRDGARSAHGAPLRGYGVRGTSGRVGAMECEAHGLPTSTRRFTRAGRDPLMGTRPAHVVTFGPS